MGPAKTERAVSRTALRWFGAEEPVHCYPDAGWEEHHDRGEIHDPGHGRDRRRSDYRDSDRHGYERLPEM